MSSCCCCQDKWCAAFCCPGLTAHKRASCYAKIQYSRIPEESSSSNDPGRPGGPILESLRIPHGKMMYSLVQDGSQFVTHPQLGVPGAIIEQPSTKSFLRRFDFVHPETQKTPDHVSGVVRVPVYRERVLNMPQNDDTDGASKDQPIVQFSLHHDIQQSKLRVHLQHATDLPKDYSTSGDVSVPERCDSFVMLHLEPDRQDTLQSHKINGTHDPVFNEMFQFGGLSVEYLKLQTLVLRLYNHALNNKAIGKVRLPLYDVELFGVIVQMKIDTEEEMEVHLLQYSQLQAESTLQFSY